MASPPVELHFFHGEKQPQWPLQQLGNHQNLCWTIPHVALSLKSRESSAMALKHIFDQIQGGQCNDPTPSPPIQERERNFGAQICGDSANLVPFGSPIATTPRFQPNPAMPKPATAQLTIFYSGTVSVYDEVPVDKAHAIMLLAGNGHGQLRPSSEAAVSTPAARPVSNRTVNSQTVSTSSQHAVSVGAGNSQTGGMCVRSVSAVAAANGQLSAPLPTPVSALPSTLESRLQSGAIQPHAGNPSELPHARKASLARFLEKRKDRVQSKPAEIGTGAEVKEEEKVAKRACSRSRSSSPSAQQIPSTSRCDSPSQCDQEEQNT